MGDGKGYEAEMTVVRAGSRLTFPRDAYVTYGLPMAGEKVRDDRGVPYEVKGIVTYVELANGDMTSAKYLTHHDPEAESVERVAKAIWESRHPGVHGTWPESVDLACRNVTLAAARAAIAAMEADNG